MGKEMFVSKEYVTDLVNQYSDTIIKIASNYLKNIFDAQDACQKVFIKIFTSQKFSFNDREHERAWIIRITINTCKDMLRNQWKKRILLVDKICLPIKEEKNKEVVSIVLSLPLKYRSVIHLYYYENFSTSEISKLLNKKESTIRTQLKRARELIKTKILGGFENEE